MGRYKKSKNSFSSTNRDSIENFNDYMMGNSDIAAARLESNQEYKGSNLTTIGASTGLGLSKSVLP